MYVDDASDRLPYNFAEPEIREKVAASQFLNWCSSVMSWELDSDNTNIVLVTKGGIGPYVNCAAGVYRCPSDWVVSDVQLQAGWSARVRSISMNAMVGDVGQLSRDGANTNNPDYTQFFRLCQVPQPSHIFVFIEEHPDSINDGYFLNHPDISQWSDLPASYHNGSVNLTFIDGHIESHKWRFARTKPPSKPDAANLPLPFPATERGDFDWLMERTSIDSD